MIFCALVKPSVLIVDDEPDIVDILDFNLEAEGYRPLKAFNGLEGIAMAQSDPCPSLVILDLMLPDISGTEVCRRLKSDPRTAGIPIVMLTARVEEYDKITGFETGADDYVTKPFSVRELMLRVRAILRRTTVDDEIEQSSPIQHGRLRVDPLAYKVWLDREEISLTALEYRLLMTLLTRAGQVQTREVLLADVWGMNPEITTRTVDTHVTRLRKKLGNVDSYIETLRGVGYRMQPSSECEKIDKTLLEAPSSS